MGDYILDFRSPRRRNPPAERTIQFFADMEIDTIQTKAFILTLTRTGSSRVWAPYTSPDGTIIGLSGRIALDEPDWDKAESIPGQGGLACKAIYNLLQKDGLPELKKLNGAFAIHVYEPEKQLYTLVLDRAGCYPTFRPNDPEKLIYSSHPDALALAADTSRNLDYVSLAAFVATGQVSHPHTYYLDVAGVEHGACIVFSLNDSQGAPPSVREERTPAVFRFDESQTETFLAAELTEAVSRATKQITQPRLGRTFIALSGGLDSRLIASHSIRHNGLHAFSIRGDEINNEFRTASAIANAVGIPLVPLIRKFDHYADSAEMGIRISGGMGSIASNHFLGFRDSLKELQYENLVTGCYFDYLFKSLAIDTRESLIFRREQLADYKFSSYLPYFQPAPKFVQPVLDRQEHNSDSSGSTDSRLQLMARRTFPVWREGDNIQRLVAQRVFDWYSPAIFYEILDVYWRTPINLRLNKTLFKKVVLNSINKELRKIKDNNTELPVGAPPILESIYRYRVALRRAISRRSRRIDTAAAWINWGFYLRESKKIEQLWKRPNSASRQIIEELTEMPFSEDLEIYLNISPVFFLRLLTIKLWLEQRD